MMDHAKLDLSSERRVRRDVWRTLSDWLGGALSLVVWLALWTWMAAAVVRPLSTLFPETGSAHRGNAVSMTASSLERGT
jgi:hypothetical protein